MDDAIPVVVLVRDLIFGSKIGSTAKALGVPLTVVRDLAKLTEVAGERRLIVDLNLEGAVDAAAGWKARTGGEVVGFVSHVDSDTIRAARVAGLDRVMPRSEFVRLLPEVLKGK